MPTEWKEIGDGGRKLQKKKSQPGATLTTSWRQH